MSLADEGKGWLLGEIIMKNRVAGRVEETQHWIDFPDELDEHIGSMKRLKLNDQKLLKNVKRLKLNLKYQVKKKSHFQKSVSFESDGVTEGLDFIKSFNEQMFPRPGVLTIELVEKQKIKKQLKLKVRGMEK